MYYGHKLNMSRGETMNTRFGEFMDLMACMAIENGAKPKKKPKSMEEILEMR